MQKAHVIDFWETRGERGSQWTPSCLSCGWTGGDGSRAEAEQEVAMHERGIHPPWVIPDGEHREWHPGKHPFRPT